MSDYTIRETTAGGQVTEHDLPLDGNSTWFDYSKAVADVIEPHLGDSENATFEVFHKDENINTFNYIHKYAGSYFINERTLPLDMSRYSGLFQLPPKTIDDTKLVNVDPEHNHNKYYHMIDNADGTWTARWGRVGDHTYDGNMSYSDHMYYIKYIEKMSKGYSDQTALDRDFVTRGAQERSVPAARKEFDAIKDPDVNGLMNRLMDYARQTIADNYTVKAADATQEMISAARRELYEMGRVKRTETFNRHYTKLLTIIPRRIDSFDRVMAKDPSGFGDIIEKERDLLDVLEGQVTLQKSQEKQMKQVKKKGRTVLDALDIEVYKATDRQKDEVMKHLSDSLKPLVKNVYRVINHKTQKAFDDHLKKMTNPKVKQLWHGSKNENWQSIMGKGLLLNPDAAITGKMFGQGIYFAPSSMKSWGYTSYSGSYWAHGNDSRAYMGLYATAYGNPYKVDSYSSIWSGFGQNDLKKLGDYDCVHADSSSGMLRNDEIIFYDQSATTINYIVEFERSTTRN